MRSNNNAHIQLTDYFSIKGIRPMVCYGVSYSGC